MKMNKFLIFVMLVFLTIAAFSVEILYTNSSGADILIEGRLIADADTITFDHYVYDDNLTFTSATPSSVVMAYEVVSETDAATTVLTFTELTDANLIIDYDASNVSDITLYFNEIDTTSIAIDIDFSYDFNTGQVYRIYLVMPQTSSSATDESGTGVTTAWTFANTPIEPGTFDLTVDASTGYTTDDGATGVISGVGTITYSTGALELASSASTITASYDYYDESNYIATVKRTF